jgi:putative transposase
VRAHLAGRSDGLTDIAPVLEHFPDIAGLLATEADEAAANALRLAETTGRPLGFADWIARLEAATGSTLRPRKRGPQPRIE